MSPRFLLAVIFGVGAACGTTTPRKPVVSPQSPPIDSALSADVQSMAGKAEALLKRQQELIWKTWTEGGLSQVDKSYEGTENLFSPTAIKKIENLRAQTLAYHRCTMSHNWTVICPDPAAVVHVQALNHLHAHFVSEYLAAGLWEQNQAIANLEASATFTSKGREVPYRDLERLLAGEKTAEGRQALYSAANVPVERITKLILHKEEKTLAILRELGFPSYEALGAELRQVDFYDVAAQANSLLQSSEEAYRKSLAELAASELGVEASGLRRSDFPRLFRGLGSAPPLAREALLPRVGESLQALGINLGELKNLTLDVRDARAKNPHPLTLTIAVPGDVRVSIKPTGNARDAALLLRELGHALPDAWPSRPEHLSSMNFELLQLGGRALHQGYGLLLGQVGEDRSWLEQAGINGDKLQQYVRVARAFRLYQLRRWAGLLLYEVELHRDSGGEPRAVYVRIMSRAGGFTPTADDQARYMIDRAEFYQSADEVRAALFAEKLRTQLDSCGGSPWWRVRAAGDLLRQLWARGNSASPEELAAEWSRP